MTVPLPLHEDTITLADGRKLGWAEYGDPKGRPVLWFHGTPGARRQVPPDTGGAAAARGLRVLSVERPGAGWSTPYLYSSVRDWAGDIADYAAQLGLKRYACMGLSGGGPWALACAHQLPHQVAVAGILGGIGPTVGSEKAPGYTQNLGRVGPALRSIATPASWVIGRVLSSVKPIAGPAGQLYARYGPLSDRPVLQNPATLEVLIDSLVKGSEGDFRAPFYDLVLFAQPWGFLMQEINVPVRFWQGDADAIVPVSHADHQASLIPDAKVFHRPGVGHFAGYSDVGSVFSVLLETWQQAQ